MNTVFDYTVKDRKGNAVSLRSYANEVLLIVNTATKSPYTPQYTELEALYEKYHSQGFAVLDFPSNQPTKSCPGKDDMVHEFVKETYNTEFPRFKKVKVSGSDADPLQARNVETSCIFLPTSWSAWSFRCQCFRLLLCALLCLFF